MAEAKLSNGITLAFESHGPASGPAIFVILGITDNITDWPAGLYQPLVDAGFRVVVHELRDSGLSSKFEISGPADLAAAKATLQRGELPQAPYTAADVAEDAALLMEYLSINSACVVGYSYGALVAQILALRRPQRVSELVLLQGSNYDPALPPRSPTVEQAMLNATQRYSSKEGAIRAMTSLRLATNGTLHAMDEKEARISAETSVARMYYPEGTARIVLSRMANPPIYAESVNTSCPTLVLHGDKDPIFPIEHGQDMAKRIPNAQLQVLEGAGHNHPRSLQPAIARYIAEFIKTNE